ncbi:catalase HPII, partial [Streptosporangium algeriense]
GLGLPAPTAKGVNHGRSSPALSQADQPSSLATRKIAVLVSDHTDAEALYPVVQELENGKAICDVIAPHEGMAGPLSVDKQVSAASSVLYDAVLCTGGAELAGDGYAVQFVREAFKHGKAVGVLPDGDALLQAAALPGRQGVVEASAEGDFVQRFVDAVVRHRHYDRDVESFPA